MCVDSHIFPSGAHGPLWTRTACLPSLPWVTLTALEAHREKRLSNVWQLIQANVESFAWTYVLESLEWERQLRGHFTFAPGFPDNPVRPCVNKKQLLMNLVCFFLFARMREMKMCYLFLVYVNFILYFSKKCIKLN